MAKTFTASLTFQFLSAREALGCSFMRPANCREMGIVVSRRKGNKTSEPCISSERYSEPLSSRCLTFALQFLQFQSATLRLQFEVCSVSRQAQMLDAGVATKLAPAEHTQYLLKRLGHDRREIDLLACQHDLIDERRALLRQALAALVAFRPERRDPLLGKHSAAGNA